MKKKLGCILLCAALAFASGCAPRDTGADGGPTPSASPAPSDGGTLVVSMHEPDTYNPLLTQSVSCAQAYGLIYDTLFVADEAQGLSPNLCESYTISGGQTFVLTLSQSAAWHDGEAFSARDVVYTFDYIRSHETPYTHLLAEVASVSETASGGVEIVLTRPNSGFLSTLTFPIIKDEDDVLVGTGPFSVSSVTQMKKITLSANKAYHRGAPHFDGAEILFINDAQTAMSAFSANQISALAGSAIDFSAFSVRDYMKRAAYPTNQYEFLAFNHNKLLFQNEVIRRAISMAINRQEIAQNALVHTVVPANAPIHPQSYLYDSSLDVTEGSAKNARDLLATNGFSDTDADGVLEKEQIVITFEILINNDDSQRQKEAELIAKSLKEAGMNARVASVAREEYYRRIESGDFDVYISGVDILNTLDLEFLLGSGGAKNFTGFQSEVLDMRLSSMARAQSAEEQAIEAQKFIRYFNQAYPICGIGFTQGELFYHQSVAGVCVNSSNIYENVFQWFFLKE